MAFGLTIGTERSAALQNSIQDELTTRGYSPDADPVMAEYITIMIINNKTPAQITSELQELIGPDFDASFVEWLFAEAAKGVPESEAPPTPAPAAAPAASSAVPPSGASTSPVPISPDAARRPGPRTGGIYQQALSQAQKRTRSPSPSHANKARRTGSDLPTGPRAMQTGPGGRSLLERMGGQSRNGYGKDDIQARIDAVTGGGAGGGNMGDMMGGFPPMGMPPNMNGMPPNMNGMNPGMNGAMNGMNVDMMGMTNPVMLQEMMMNQMALMAQMAGAMGMLNPGQLAMNGPPPGTAPGAFPGFDGMGMIPGMVNGDGGRGRGRGRGGRGIGRGRGGGSGHGSGYGGPQSESNISSGPGESAPAPAPSIQQSASTLAQPQPHFPMRPSTAAGSSLPTRPLSPTLCKFSSKCTNAHCRWSHPSPVATPESGVVLSNEACERGVECVDKDCVKAHVSPAVTKALHGGEQVNGAPAPTAPATGPTHLNPKAPAFSPSPVPPATTTPTFPQSNTSASHSPHQQSTVPCRYGTACTRPGCTFQHPPAHRNLSLNHGAHGGTTGGAQSTVPCRFGASCTRATCPFAHPEGRGVLPGTFHRGLGLGAGTTDGTGASPHRSVTFNKPAPPVNAAPKGKEEVKADGVDSKDATAKETAKDLERRVREVEERKNAVERQVKEAEAAVAAAAASKA